MKGKTKKRTSWMQRMRLIALSLVLVLIFSMGNPFPVLASDSTEETLDTEETKTGSNASKKDYKYEATIYSCYYDNDFNRLNEFIYEYKSNNSPLLMVYDRGDAFGSYLKDKGSIFFNLFTINADGTMASAPNLNQIASNIILSDGTYVDSKTFNYPLDLSKIRAFSSSTYILNVTGDYEVIAYTSTIYDIETGEKKTNPTPAEVAYYYYKAGDFGKMHGWRAFTCELSSRSIQDNFTAKNNTGFSIMEPELDGNIFRHSGSVYSLGDPYRCGIEVIFGYNCAAGSSSSTSLRYYYWLPLDAGEYTLNLADYKSIYLADGNLYNLTTVTFRPLIQTSVTSLMQSGQVITYTAAQLEEAGCFENGGDPVCAVGSDTGSDDGVHGTQGDPSIGDTYVKPDSIQTPNELEWNESEHSFWENVLHFLENIANNIAAAGTAIISLPNLLKDMLEDFFNKMYEYYFVPDEVLYKARIDSLNARFGFVDDIKSVANYIMGVFDISNGKVPPKYTIPISCEAWNMDTEVVIDFSWYKPFKPMFDILIAGFCWLTFAYNIWRKLPEIISGAGMDISYISREVSRSDLEIPEADIVSYKLPTFEWYFK